MVGVAPAKPDRTWEGRVRDSTSRPRTRHQRVRRLIAEEAKLGKRSSFAFDGSQRQEASSGSRETGRESVASPLHPVPMVKMRGKLAEISPSKTVNRPPRLANGRQLGG